jgi:hypothetical protein
MTKRRCIQATLERSCLLLRFLLALIHNFVEDVFSEVGSPHIAARPPVVLYS